MTSLTEPIFTLGVGEGGGGSHNQHRRRGGHAPGKHHHSPSSHAHKHLPRSASDRSASWTGMSADAAAAAVAGAGAAGVENPAPVFSQPTSVLPPQPAPAAPAFGSSQPAFHIGTSTGSPPSARKTLGKSQSARHRSSSAFPKETPAGPLESLFAAAVATPLPQTSEADKQQLPASGTAGPPAPTQAPAAPLHPPGAPPAAPAPNAVPLPSASLAAAAAAAKAPSGVQQAARSSGPAAPAVNGPADRQHSMLGDSSAGPAKAGERTHEDFQILSERFRRLMQSAQEAVPDTTSAATSAATTSAAQQQAAGSVPAFKAPAPAFSATTAAAAQNQNSASAPPARTAAAAAAAAPQAVPPTASAPAFAAGSQHSSSSPSFAAAAPAAAAAAAAPSPAPVSANAGGVPAPGPAAPSGPPMAPSMGPSMGTASGPTAPTAATPFMAPLFTAGSQAPSAAGATGVTSGAMPPSPTPAAAPDGPKFTFGAAGGGTPGSAGKHSARRRGGRGRGATPTSPAATSTPTPTFSAQAASNPPGSASTNGATHPGYSPMAWSPQYEPSSQGTESRSGNQGAAASTPPRLFGIGSVGSAFSSSSPDQMASEGGDIFDGSDGSGFAGPGVPKHRRGAGVGTSGLSSSGFGSNAFESLGTTGWGSSNLNSFGSSAFTSGAAPHPNAFTADALSAGHKHLDQMHRQHAHAQAQKVQQEQEQQQQQQQHKAQMHAQQQEQQQQQQQDTSLPKDADSKQGWAAESAFHKGREQQQQQQQQQQQVPVFGAGVHANQQQQQQQQQVPVFGAGVRANQQQQQQQQQQQVPVFGAGVRANSQPPPVFTSHFPFEFSSPGGTTHRTKSASVAAQAQRAGGIPSFTFVAAPPQPVPTAAVPPQPSTSSTAGAAAPAPAAEPAPPPPAAAPTDAAAAAAAASHHRRHYRARSSGRVPQHGDGSAPSEQPAAAQQQWKQSSRSAQPTGRQIQASNAKLKGNADYAAQNYQSAESAYTAALELLQADGIGGTEAAVLHSNRAGARLMVGKPAAALADALMAVQLDPKFFKAVSRAATCHCRMGDFASAKRILDKVLDKLSASSTHFQDIYKKLHEVEALMRSMEVVSSATLKHKAEKDSLLAALNMLDAVHPQVVYSEPMAALRVRTLLACNRPSDALSAMEVHYEAPSCIKGAPWRIWLGVQARYHMGDLAGAIHMCEQLVQKLEHRASSSSNGSSGSAGLDEEAAAFGGNSEAALAFAALRLPTKEELGHLLEHMKKLQSAKAEGNTAVKNGNHQLAVEKYTVALSHNAPPVFAAVLYSNRAAAHQGLGQITDAMADCARARALDPNYVRATTRLATLLQEVRRSELAADILTSITQGSSDSSLGFTPSERQAITNQITTARATAAWQKTHDHYRVMGLERSCSEDEVRKTYRKAALKYHPDKAVTLCRFNLAPPLSPGSKCLEAEGELVPVVFIAGQGAGVDARVLAEANWLFSLIGQAHEELSDKAKRRRYDMLLDAEHPPPTKTRYASTNPYTRYDPFAGFPGSYSSAFRKPSGGRPSAGSSYASGAGGARSGTSNFSSFGARNFNSRGSSSSGSGSTGYGAGPQGRTSNTGSRPQHKSSWYRRASHAFSESDDDEEDTSY